MNNVDVYRYNNYMNDIQLHWLIEVNVYMTHGDDDDPLTLEMIVSDIDLIFFFVFVSFQLHLNSQLTLVYVDNN